jgi:hypothetical protein
MTEAPVLFGPERNLMGILTSAPPADPPQPIACLLLNVGVTHRVGPRRLNVKLARQLALLGIPSLRLDLSGIGDSAATHSRSSFREQSIHDLQSAMDLVEANTGIRRFVVLGICSGAANGYWVALADPRVVGLLMFDGFTFPTFKTHLIHDWQRLRTTPTRTVIAKAVRRVKRLFGIATEAAPASIFNAVSDVSLPTRDEFGRALQTLVERGVSLYLIYSGSLLVHHNYHGQLNDAFGNAPFLGRMRYDYMPDVDHIATPLAAQKKLMTTVCDWLLGIVAASTAEHPRPHH